MRGAGEGGGWQKACMLVYAMYSSPAPSVTGGEAHGGRDSPVRASEPVYRRQTVQSPVYLPSWFFPLWPN